MSNVRVPEGVDSIVLRVHLLDNMATVEACWDYPVGLTWIESAYGTSVVAGRNIDVSVIWSKGSQHITDIVAREIAIRWMKGEYVSVNFQAGL